MNTLGRLLPTALLITTLLVPRGADACTGIKLVAADGTVVRARTLEFGFDLQSEVIVVPRNFKRIGTRPQGTNGLEWRTKYASVGANGVALPFLFDGINEKGLAVGLFYFPTTAKFPPFDPAKAGKTIAPWEVGSWIAEKCIRVHWRPFAVKQRCHGLDSPGFEAFAPSGTPSSDRILRHP